MSAVVKSLDCLANGAGIKGMGWVGQVCSPGKSDFGTGTSFISNSGSPVSRLKRKTKPCFVT